MLYHSVDLYSLLLLTLFWGLWKALGFRPRYIHLDILTRKPTPNSCSRHGTRSNSSMSALTFNLELLSDVEWFFKALVPQLPISRDLSQTSPFPLKQVLSPECSINQALQLAGLVSHWYLSVFNFLQEWPAFWSLPEGLTSVWSLWIFPTLQMSLSQSMSPWKTPLQLEWILVKVWIS